MLEIILYVFCLFLIVYGMDGEWWIDFKLLILVVNGEILVIIGYW